MKRIMIMAAGTGGHIFPGLAIANELRAHGWEVSWLGTTTGMEQTHVPKAGIEMDSLAFTGLRGKGLAHGAKGAVNLVKSIKHCVDFMRKRKPDIVLGMGGYVTVPGGVAAKVLGIPLVLVNADSALLMSNKLLAPIAKKVLFGIGYDDSLPAGKVVETGNPVRPEISSLAPPNVRFQGRTGPLRLLVVGGSLGASVLNDVVPRALAMLPEDMRPQVTHQTGQKNADTVTALYASLGQTGTILPFIDDMAAQYEKADLIICRAGAVTLSELTACGVASILVPMVASTTSHQRNNAQWLSGQHGAFHLPQTDLSPELLAELLKNVDRKACLAMSNHAYAQRKHRSTKHITSILNGLVA